MLAALQLPDVDSAIVPATGERAAIGTHLERLDCPLVRPARVHALSALDVPPAEHTVAATADQHRTGRTPSERIHDLAQFAQGVQALSTVGSAAGTPDEELSTASTSATTGQARPIRAPGHAHNHTTMPLQAGLLRSGEGLPQDDAAIVAATGQLRSIWTPRHPTDRGWLPMTNPLVDACAHFPHLHLLLIAPTGQKLSIWTPRYAEEGGIDVVGAAQGLHTSFCGRVPHLDGIVQPTACQPPPIRTPRDSIRHPTVAAQQPGRGPAITLPNGHQCIGACTGKPGAIRVPGHVVERDRVALDNSRTLAALHVPYPQGAIFTATEQAVAIGREGESLHNGSMPVERCAIAAPFDIPEPNRMVTAATSQQAPIRAPDHSIHRGGVSRERLTYL